MGSEEKATKEVVLIRYYNVLFYLFFKIKIYIYMELRVS